MQPTDTTEIQLSVLERYEVIALIAENVDVDGLLQLVDHTTLPPSVTAATPATEERLMHTLELAWSMPVAIATGGMAQENS